MKQNESFGKKEFDEYMSLREKVFYALDGIDIEKILPMLISIVAEVGFMNEMELEDLLKLMTISTTMRYALEMSSEDSTIH